MSSPFASFGNALFGVTPVSSQPYTSQADQDQQRANQYAGREQSDYNNQTAVGDSLWKTVNGTGPSVAQTQLGQTLDQQFKQNLAQGAGANGPSAVLARYQTLINNGNQQAQTAQAGAMLRAKEVSDAQARLGALYGNMAGQSAGLYGTNANLGLGYSGLANNVNEANAQRNQQSEAAGLQFLSGIGSMYFGRPPSMGGGSGGGASGGGVPNSLLGSSDPTVSNAAWDAYGA